MTLHIVESGLVAKIVLEFQVFTFNEKFYVLWYAYQKKDKRIRTLKQLNDFLKLKIAVMVWSLILKNARYSDTLSHICLLQQPTFILGIKYCTLKKTMTLSLFYHDIKQVVYTTIIEYIYIVQCIGKIIEV